MFFCVNFFFQRTAPYFSYVVLRLSVPQVPEIENAFLPLTLLFSMIPLYTDQDLQLKYMCIQVILADN